MALKVRTSKLYYNVLSKIIIGSFICFILSGLEAQSFYNYKDLRFKHFQIKDGLPSNTVLDIIQDKKGFLWLATHSGIIRYDGFSFYRLVEPGKYASNFNNAIAQTLIEDASGNIWVGSARQGLFYYNPVNGKVHNFLLSNSEVQPRINELKEDQDGNIWIGSNQFLSIVIPDSQEIEKSSIITSKWRNEETSTAINTIEVIGSNEVWVGSNNGLNKVEFDNQSQEIQYFATPDFKDKSVLNIVNDNNEAIWISTLDHSNPNGRINGLFEISLGQNVQPEFYRLPESMRGLRDLMITKEKELWIATMGQGVFVLDMASLSSDNQEVSQNNLKQYKISADNDFPIGRNHIYTAFQDQSGSVWIGTWLKGLYQISPDINKFKIHTLPEYLENENKAVFTVAQQSENEFLISTFLNGLIHYNSYSKDFTVLTSSVSPDGKFPGQQALNIYKSKKNDTWVLGGRRSLNKYNGVDQPLTTVTLGDDLFNNNLLPPQLRNTFLHGITEDPDGNLWIGSNGLGLFQYDPDLSTVTSHYTSLKEDSLGIGSNRILHVLYDQNNHLWISCDDYGLYEGIMQPDSSFNFYGRTPGVSTIFDIEEGENGILWLATLTKGLIEYNTESKEIKYYTSDDGIPYEGILDIIIDDDGFLWLVTPKGLGKFDPNSKKCTIYDQAQGLNFDQRLINSGSNYNGKISMANTEGFYSFDPNDLNNLSTASRAEIIAIRIENEIIKPFDFNGLNADLPYNGRVDFSHEIDDLAIEYVGLYSESPSQISYRYMLEGYQNDWSEVGTERIARFSNLKPDNYIFHVQASTGTGEWSAAKSLEINISPPWWNNSLAKFIYLIAFLSILYWLYHLHLSKRIQKIENERLKTLDEEKTKLYTDLTHEIRTPLTVISGIAREIQNNPSKGFHDGIDMIIRNSDQLQGLTDQMLELNKIKAGGSKPHYQNGDIISYLKYVLDSFSTYASQKDIHLHFINDLEKFYMDYDPEKLLIVVSNLLSNAIKFTEEGSDIYVQIQIEKSNDKKEEQNFVIVVRDRGIGIDKKDIPFIFDRFYQVKHGDDKLYTGTGIGLALCQEIMRLLNGEINVQSKKGQGTIFTLKFPVISVSNIPHDLKTEDLENRLRLYKGDGVNSAEVKQFNNESKSVILIVEDNSDVSKYVARCLEEDYNLLFSEDGQKGFDMAIKQMPDIILSDVRMPVMNGFEMSGKLKEDPRTEHIPIILLTAKIDQKSRLEGLAIGVESYLTKPFNKDELLLRIDKTLERRQALQSKYSSLFEVQKQAATNSVGNDFLDKLNDILKEHLEDEDFGIKDICRAMAISRIQLHRKLKFLTNLSTSHYIRRFKLKKACILLEDTDLSVSEVAYSVGFKSPVYFTQIFTEQYGFPPSKIKRDKN